MTEPFDGEWTEIAGCTNWMENEQRVGTHVKIAGNDFQVTEYFPSQPPHTNLGRITVSENNTLWQIAFPGMFGWYAFGPKTTFRVQETHITWILLRAVPNDKYFWILSRQGYALSDDVWQRAIRNYGLDPRTAKKMTAVAVAIETSSGKSKQSGRIKVRRSERIIEDDYDDNVSTTDEEEP